MDDPLGYLPGYVLRRASIATMGRLHQHLGAHDLRATEASLILLIGERTGLTQSEAGRSLGIKRANMVRCRLTLIQWKFTIGTWPLSKRWQKRMSQRHA